MWLWHQILPTRYTPELFKSTLHRDEAYPKIHYNSTHPSTFWSYKCSSSRAIFSSSIPNSVPFQIATLPCILLRAPGRNVINVYRTLHYKYGIAMRPHCYAYCTQTPALTGWTTVDLWRTLTSFDYTWKSALWQQYCHANSEGAGCCGCTETALIISVSEPVHRMLLAPWDLHSATDLFGHPRRSNLLHGAIRAADLTQ